MRSTMLAGRQLLIATASGASWYFGAQLPAELVAHFTGIGQTIVAAQIMRFTNNFYFFVGMVLEAPSGDDFFIVEGHVLNLNVAVDSYTHFDDPTNLASIQFATGDDLYQVRVGGGNGQVFLLFDYLGANNDVTLGDLNNHVIIDSVTDTVLIEADATINMGGFNNHVIIDMALDRILIECDDRVRIDGGGKGFISETMRHSRNRQDSISSTASASYANLTNIAGTSFVAPESGIVTIFYTAQMASDATNGVSFLSPRIGTGGTVGAGTQVLAAADVNAIIFVQHATAGEALRMGAQLTVTGLTAGDTYNVSMQGRAQTAGTSSFLRIETTVVPSP